MNFIFFKFIKSEISIRGLATAWTYFLRLSLSSVILTDSSTDSPVHVLMLSIQAVRGLPRLRAPGIVPCIISFSRQLPWFLMVCPWYDGMLASLLWRCSLFCSVLQPSSIRALATPWTYFLHLSLVLCHSDWHFHVLMLSSVLCNWEQLSTRSQPHLNTRKLSTNRPSFAAANQVATLTRLATERVV